MEVYRTRSFENDFAELPDKIQTQFALKLKFFLHNAFHPSLHTKKMQGTNGIWEFRISKDYRCTFLMRSNACVLRRIGPHDILRTP